MTHGTHSELTRELNEKNRSQALRIFITGLHQPLGDIIFSLQPSDLPSALAKAQELESNNLRTQFANQFKRHDTIQSNKKFNKFISRPNQQNNLTGKRQR